jgi:hypothetical protein
MIFPVVIKAFYKALVNGAITVDAWPDVAENQ